MDFYIDSIMEESATIVKLLVLGNFKVGKTYLIRHIAQQPLGDSYEPTFGVVFTKATYSHYRFLIVKTKTVGSWWLFHLHRHRQSLHPLRGRYFSLIFRLEARVMGELCGMDAVDTCYKAVFTCGNRV